MENWKPTYESKKESHLIEPFKPIITCIGNEYQTAENAKECAGNHPSKFYVDSEWLDVDWFSDESDPDGFEIMRAISGGYKVAISEVNKANKVSYNYKDCLGLVIVGKDEETGVDKSFLLHADPESIYREFRNDLNFALARRIAKLKSECVEGSVDSVMYGGWFNRDSFNLGYEESVHHIAALNTLNGEIERMLGFKPPVVSGGSSTRGKRDAYFVTNERKLFIGLSKHSTPHPQTFTVD